MSPRENDVQKAMQRVIRDEEKQVNFLEKKPKKKFKLFLWFWFGIFSLSCISFLFLFILNKYNVSHSKINNFKAISIQDIPALFARRFIDYPSNKENIEIPEDISVQENMLANDKIKEGKIIREASLMKKSKNNEWWLNSGGIATIGDNELSTNMGPLPEDSFWQKLYFKTNKEDTDNGYYPQNIFRLVTRNKWKNISQAVYFSIEALNMSKSENRNESNGILFFNRYVDGNNLYYVGLRVDGEAVIKKKINEEYFTMAEKKVFENEEKYDKEKNPNLIPVKNWIGLKSEVENDDDAVLLRLFIDKDQSGNWQLVMETKDREGKYGGAAFMDKGYAGIRTDFMDVQFKNYKIEELKN